MGGHQEIGGGGEGQWKAEQRKHAPQKGSQRTLTCYYEGGMLFLFFMENQSVPPCLSSCNEGGVFMVLKNSLKSQRRWGALYLFQPPCPSFGSCVNISGLQGLNGNRRGRVDSVLPCSAWASLVCKVRQAPQRYFTQESCWGAVQLVDYVFIPRLLPCDSLNRAAKG
jgi:hypothetical protein